MKRCSLFVAAVLAHALHPSQAADLVVYDDATRNGFDQNCTFGGVAGDFDFSNAAPVHGGSASIRYTPEGFNALSWCAPTTPSTSTYRGISLWINGGAAGAQDLQLVFARAGSAVASAPLADLAGAPIPNGAWIQVNAAFDSGPLQFSGSFDQLWIQSSTNAAQADVYLDDIALLGRGATTDALFADGFDGGLRGINLVGMEMDYAAFAQATGPVEDVNYPRHDTRLVDYYAAKHVAAMRFLFSWEGMQSSLYGPVPAADSGNYRIYFDDYKRIVDYATGVAHLQVIVEPWQANAGGGAGGAMWRGNLVGSAAVPDAAFADFWSKIALVFKDNPRVSFGLVNEPNNMSTMSWWHSAQTAVNAIRGTGSRQRILVPGNGYTAAGTWTSGFYDTALPQRSNAYGWLNANGPGVPIFDPLDDIVAEVHCYVDADGSGSSTGIVAFDTARQRIGVALDEAAAHHYRIHLGEIGLFAGHPLGAQAWADFIAYFEANPAVFVGYNWWAGGAPGWWDDVGANGGGHFSVTPTNGIDFSGDSVNMTLIEGAFSGNP